MDYFLEYKLSIEVICSVNIERLHAKGPFRSRSCYHNKGTRKLQEVIESLASGTRNLGLYLKTVSDVTQLDLNYLHAHQRLKLQTKGKDPH